MQFKSKTEVYRVAVVEWLGKNNYKVSEHIIDIIISVLQTRDGEHSMAGSFVKALCNNDLRETFRYADNEVLQNMKTILLAYHNISVYEFIATSQPARKSIKSLIII
jgi:hypothetical protein